MWFRIRIVNFLNLKKNFQPEEARARRWWEASEGCPGVNCDDVGDVDDVDDVDDDGDGGDCGDDWWCWWLMVTVVVVSNAGWPGDQKHDEIDDDGDDAGFDDAGDYDHGHEKHDIDKECLKNWLSFLAPGSVRQPESDSRGEEERFGEKKGGNRDTSEVFLPTFYPLFLPFRGDFSMFCCQIEEAPKSHIFLPLFIRFFPGPAITVILVSFFSILYLNFVISF